MGALDKINQMKAQGTPDNEIVSNLQQQGVDPKSINDAMNQSQIKSAVYGDENLAHDVRGDIPPEPPVPGTFQNAPGRKEMPQEQYEQPPMPEQMPAPAPQEYSNEEYYPQEYSNQGSYGEYGEPATGGVDTFIEVAEQVFSEKIKSFEKALEDLNEFKALNQVKIDHALERIKRIENAMDKLQLAILDKVGSYGKTLESVKKEMGMMQNTFSKAAKPHSSKATTKKTVKKPVKKKVTRKKK